MNFGSNLGRLQCRFATICLGHCGLVCLQFLSQPGVPGSRTRSKGEAYRSLSLYEGRYSCEMYAVYCVLQAERAIKDGAEQGLWVILQNCESLKDVL